MRRFLRWLMLALPVFYVIGAIGVFARTISDKRFKHSEHELRTAAFDALQWPADIPDAAREVWRAGRRTWDDFSR